jgi:hypothetical protein
MIQTFALRTAGSYEPQGEITHPGNRAFYEGLNRIENERELLRALGRYVHFNSVFGSGVAHLAGEIGSRKNLFLDDKEPVEVLRDRSVEVASSIFYAAIDEFGDRGFSGRITHRAMAKATLKAVATFIGCVDEELNQLLKVEPSTCSAVEAVRWGYGLNRTMDECDILRGIGFHLGSETLADVEFRILDTFLCTREPELVDWLNATDVALDASTCSAYDWIKIHTTVETEHSDAGLAAATLAIQYHNGPDTRASAEQAIEEGFEEFSRVQTKFMQGYLG